MLVRLIGKGGEAAVFEGRLYITVSWARGGSACGLQGEAGQRAVAQDLGGQALVETVREDTHTCYLGERSVLHPWGYGCGECPACQLRQRGYEQWRARGHDQDRGAA